MGCPTRGFSWASGHGFESICASGEDVRESFMAPNTVGAMETALRAISIHPPSNSAQTGANIIRFILSGPYLATGCRFEEHVATLYMKENARN